MHPVIRILGVLTLLVFLSRADWLGLLPVAVLLLVLYAASGVAKLRKLARMLQRLRYFYLAILLVFGLTTPGTPVADIPGLAWLTVTGLGAGAERVVGLTLIVAAVHWLLETTTRDELAGGLYWLLQPLAWIGISVERFVLRLVLTLERIEQMLDHARRARGQVPDGGGARDTLVARAAHLFEETLRRAEAEAGVMVSLQLAAVPGALQWLGWSLFAAGLAGLSQLGGWW